MTEASAVFAFFSSAAETIVQALAVFVQALAVLTLLASSTELFRVRACLITIALLAQALAVLALLSALAERVGVVGGWVAVAGRADALAVFALLARPKKIQENKENFLRDPKKERKKENFPFQPALPVRVQGVLVALAAGQQALAVGVALVATWAQ